MSYCINPLCQERWNPDNSDFCQACQTELVINERYRLIRPLHHPSAEAEREICLVEVGGDSEGKPLVIKIIAATRSDSTEAILFQRGAKVMERLKHKGIPRYENYIVFDQCQGCNRSKRLKLHCLVMEKIDGDNLEEWVERNGAISQDLALHWLKKLTEILHYVHQQQLFHRDIKPSNIMRNSEGNLVLIDFGAVRELTRTYQEKIDRDLEDITRIYSERGYTPTEQLLGRAVPQSDFFAIGRTFVYLLTGKHPCEFENPETGKLIGWRECVPQISPSLADFIEELMAPAHEKRPRSTGEILQRLEKIDLSATPEPKKRRFVGKGTIASACLLLGIIGFWSSLPAVADFLYLRGLEYKHEGQLYKAHFYYNWAVRLQPGHAKTHYNLGSLYEDWHQLDDARREYIKAAQQNLPDAINNLARLDIRAGNYEVAVNRLLEGLKQAKNDFVISTLYKNLGWARVKQGRYSDAEADLRMAIALDKGKASAHCLLAQSLEGQKKVKAAQESWENCLRYGSSDNIDEDSWINLAQQRLVGGDKI